MTSTALRVWAGDCCATPSRADHVRSEPPSTAIRSSTQTPSTTLAPATHAAPRSADHTIRGGPRVRPLALGHTSHRSHAAALQRTVGACAPAMEHSRVRGFCMVVGRLHESHGRRSRGRERPGPPIDRSFVVRRSQEKTPGNSCNSRIPWAGLVIRADALTRSSRRRSVFRLPRPAPASYRT